MIRGWSIVFIAIVWSGMVFLPTAMAQTLAEALDSDLSWSTGGDAPWAAQGTNSHDGFDAVCSGIVGSNRLSWIETMIEGPATLRFWSKRVPGDAVWLLSFSVNGESQPGQIASAGSQWTEQVRDLPAGSNQLRWTVSLYSGPGTMGFVVFDEVRVESPRALAFAQEPQSLTLFSGEPASLSVSVIGTPPYHYQWRKNGEPIEQATNAWFFLSVASTDHSGSYSVIVGNSQGSITSSNAMVVVLPPTAPMFESEPASVTAYAGESVYLFAQVDGSPPFDFQWWKNGTVLEGAGSVESYPGSESLTLTNVSQADAGVYTVSVSNAVGGIQSSNALVTVLPSTPPAIITEPRSIDVAAGANTWLSVEAVGTPAPGYRWSRVGDTDPPAPFPAPPKPLRPYPSFSFFNATPSNSGVYFVEAVNCAGVARSRDVLLTVLSPITDIGSWWQSAEDVFVTNRLAFLAQGEAGLGILDVTDPAQPVLLGRCNTPGHASAVQVVGDLAYIADGPAGLQILNVANPRAPFLQGAYSTPRPATEVLVRSNHAFVAADSAGLIILDVTDASSPRFLGAYSSNVRARTLAWAGGFVLLSSPVGDALPGTNVAALVIVDVSEPAQPIERGRLAGGFYSMDARDSVVVGVNGIALRAVTITNPAEPVVIGSLNSYPTTNWPPRTGLEAYHLRWAGERAYLAGDFGEQGRLLVVDVRDPAHPIPAGHFVLPNPLSRVWVDAARVFLPSYDGPMAILETPFSQEVPGGPTLRIQTGAGVTLEIQGRPGCHYEIQRKADLAAQSWESLKTVLLTNVSQSVEITSPGLMGFFRVRQQ
jgi:hypothetical protein